MLTLFQVMTFDGWSGVIRPIVYKAPEAVFLLMLFIGIAGIMLGNLMTAIVVKNAFDTSAADEELTAQLKQIDHQNLQHELSKMFEEIDEDKSGMLSKEEFTDVLDDVLFIRKMKVLDIELEELGDIFEILDDGDGEISTDEFCMGLTRMQGLAMSSDLMNATQRMRGVNNLLETLDYKMMVNSSDAFDRMDDNLDQASRQLIEMQFVSAEFVNALNKVGLRRTVKLTTKDLPSVPEPDIKDVLSRERAARVKLAKEKASRRYSKKLTANRNNLQKPSPLENSGPHLKPLPASWILERKGGKKAPGVHRPRQKTDTEAEAPQILCQEQLPGVPQHVKDECIKLQISFTPGACALRGAAWVEPPELEKEQQVDEKKDIAVASISCV